MSKEIAQSARNAFSIINTRSHDSLQRVGQVGGENLVLKSIVDRSITKPEVNSLVEGSVILIEKSSVFVALSPFGTGIIYGREFINARDIIKK